MRISDWSSDVCSSDLLSPVAAGLITRIDVRLTISAGILWMAVMSIVRASWNADVGYWTLALPHILQGIGMPFFFVGLTALALSSVPAPHPTSAAGLMSFLRTLCGAIRTAIETTAWDDSTGPARSAMGSHPNNAN